MTLQLPIRVNALRRSCGQQQDKKILYEEDLVDNNKTRRSCEKKILCYVCSIVM